MQSTCYFSVLPKPPNFSRNTRLIINERIKILVLFYKRNRSKEFLSLIIQLKDGTIACDSFASCHVSIVTYVMLRFSFFAESRGLCRRKFTVSEPQSTHSNHTYKLELVQFSKSIHLISATVKLQRCVFRVQSGFQ